MRGAAIFLQKECGRQISQTLAFCCVVVFRVSCLAVQQQVTKLLPIQKDECCCSRPAGGKIDEA